MDNKKAYNETLLIMAPVSCVVDRSVIPIYDIAFLDLRWSKGY